MSELKTRWGSSAQDVGVGRQTAPPPTTKRGLQQFKNKKQPELTEIQTTQKSDDQGDKEETFIKTDRRRGDGQRGKEDFQQRSQTWIVEQGRQYNC